MEVAREKQNFASPRADTVQLNKPMNFYTRKETTQSRIYVAYFTLELVPYRASAGRYAAIETGDKVYTKRIGSGDVSAAFYTCDCNVRR